MSCSIVTTALVHTSHVIHRSTDGRCARPLEMDLGAWRRAVHGWLHEIRLRI